MGSGYRDRDGKRIDLERWVQLMEDGDFQTYRRIAVDQIGPVWISTVWTGVDIGDDDLFETMIEPEGGPRRFHRSATESAARDIHAAAVRAVCAVFARMPPE